MKSFTKKLFFAVGALALLFLILSVRFPTVTFVSPDQHDVLSISNLSTLQHFYGTLTDAPHLYTFRIAEPTDVSLTLFVPDIGEQKNDVSVLVLRKKERGLDLVTRLDAARASWVSTYWWEVGDTYRKGGEWHNYLEAGMYEVEVSTPSNRGSYVLTLGAESTTTLLSYAHQVRTVFRIKEFFHKSSFASLESPLLFIPTLLSIGVGATLFRAYRRGKGVLY